MGPAGGGPGRALPARWRLTRRSGARALTLGRCGLGLLILPTLGEDLLAGRWAAWVGWGSLAATALAVWRPRGALGAGLWVALVGLGLGSQVEHDLMNHHRWLLAGLLVAVGGLSDPALATFAVRAQLGAVYGFGGLDKLLDPAFRRGVRLIQIELERDPASAWLDHPPLAAPGLAWLVILWQLAVPIGLFWRRARLLTAASALVFHLLVELWLPVGTFGLVCGVAWWIALRGPDERRAPP